LPTIDHDPGRRPPPPPEKTFWELLPRRNLRRALFLIAALIAVVVIKRMGGFSFAKLFDGVAPAPPRAPADRQAAPFQHLEVKPR